MFALICLHKTLYICVPSVGVISSSKQKQRLGAEIIKVSHIKVLYVREACYAVGVLFLLVSHSPASVGPQAVTPVKPPVVAEWGSGVTPRLDPDTISKHVKQMVDVSM